MNEQCIDSKKNEIIIVSGLPRSGTSLMMMLLEAGGIPILTDNLRTSDVDNPKGYYEFEPVKSMPKGNNQWLSQATGKAVKVISSLLKFLPPDHCYKIILMRRRIDEIMASQARMIRNRQENSDRISDAEMSMLFEKHLHDISAWLKRQDYIEHIEISYNEILRAPETAHSVLSSFLDHALDTDQMISMIDRSLYRQKSSA